MLILKLHEDQAIPYEFDSKDELQEFLDDLDTPTDTELFDMLDDLAPHGWRLCLDAGMCPSTPEMNASLIAPERCAGGTAREVAAALVDLLQGGREQ